MKPILLKPHRSIHKNAHKIALIMIVAKQPLSQVTAIQRIHAIQNQFNLPNCHLLPINNFPQKVNQFGFFFDPSLFSVFLLDFLFYL